MNNVCWSPDDWERMKTNMQQTQGDAVKCDIPLL